MRQLPDPEKRLCGGGSERPDVLRDVDTTMQIARQVFGINTAENAIDRYHHPGIAVMPRSFFGRTISAYNPSRSILILLSTTFLIQRRIDGFALAV